MGQRQRRFWDVLGALDAWVDLDEEEVVPLDIRFLKNIVQFGTLLIHNPPFEFKPPLHLRVLPFLFIHLKRIN